MDKLLKRSLLVISGVIMSIFFIFTYFGLDTICPYLGKKCFGLSYNFLMNFYWFVPIFLFSLITYFMRKETFYSWFKFTCFWVAFSMFLIMVSSDYDGESYVGISSKGLAIIFTHYFYFLISLAIIITKQLQYWREGKSIQ